MIWIRVLFILEALLMVILESTKKEYYYSENEGVENSVLHYYNKFILLLITVSMIFVSALRNNFIDTLDYRYMYGVIGRNISNVFNGSVPGVEKGYLFFTYILNLLNSNSQFLLIVTSIIIISLTVQFIRKQSVDVTFSLWMFFCMDFLNTMNGIRQVMAGAIVVFLWLQLIQSPKSFKCDLYFICGVLLLSTIHKSVLICIPIMLLCRGHILNWATKLVAFGTIIMLAVPGFYYTFLDGLLGDTGYAQYIHESATMGIARFAVNSVTVILVFYCHTHGANLREEDEITQSMVNLCIFNFCCSVLALRMVYFARLGMFFKYFDYIVLPLLLHKYFGKNQTLIKAIAYILYGVFYFVQVSAFGGYISGFKLII